MINKKGGLGCDHCFKEIHPGEFYMPVPIHDTDNVMTYHIRCYAKQIMRYLAND